MAGIKPGHDDAEWESLKPETFVAAVRIQGGGGDPAYSTVTDLARLRGWSTSVPITTAV
ncbi:hypothetical protein ACVIJ6_006173 [Bradyrhizobium sp. USDA 4369]